MKTKKPIDHLGLQVFCQMSAEEEHEAGDREAAAIFRDLYRCVEIARLSHLGMTVPGHGKKAGLIPARRRKL